MNTKSDISSLSATFLASPQLTFISLFVAVVLGSSLIQFNELLFPPKITSLSFWAILPAYYFALDGWFGIVAWGRYTPYTDKPLARIWVTCTLLAWTTLLAIMHFASRLPESLLSYMWGPVFLFITLYLGYTFRQRDTSLSQPIRLCAQFGSLAFIAALAYSIWGLAFPPVPAVANWIFVFIAFAIMVGYRLSLRMTHVWRTEERHAKRS